MAKGQSKCKNCGRYFPTETMVEVNNQKYCADCAPAFRLEANANTAINRILYELCDNNASYLPRFRREITKMQEEYKCHATTILKLFQYVFSLEDPPEFDPEKGVGWIIRQYYSQAKAYYDALMKQRGLYSDDILQEYMERPVKEIHIKRSVMVQHDIDFYEAQKDAAYGPEIDLNSLFDFSSSLQEDK